MEIKIYPTYEALSAKVAEWVLMLMSAYDKPLLCPASGDTPAGLYKVLSERYLQQKGGMDGWSFVGLDEWVGLNASDEGSCRHFIDKTLFHPLEVTGERICFFDGRSANLPKECRDAEQFISLQNGIDVAILGLGMNGHIAMNEPGCAVDGRAQIVALHPVTKLVGQKYFTQQLELEEGITLGMGTLLESKHIILMVSGKHKSRIVRKMLEEPATNELPGSLLLCHPSVTIFLDEDAASGLSNKDLHGYNRN
ncbi:glucosamine-6-phosphate deaminase [Chitinophaga sp. G-6-1-13]|uniref:Glucosamine-6-phosphate deaminase n=1 Tax=Chitinophaga fulva TaxID=2728842 RepID=A0A848GLG6_9BACT|nr:glucosamine-6-phosphate deaminase [Chitinophaga fulva]NML37832.1 glucosamine-6-phosphate deaminase [Chitinophaga fulva]